MNISTLTRDTVGTAGERPLRGGSVTWACSTGFAPSTIFPFTPPERIGTRNLFEFQMLMYRPLYWLGADGGPGVDEDLSLAEPPEWSADGRTVTITLKPWNWSNGEPICADNVLFWVNMMAVKGPRYGSYAPGYFPDNLVAREKVSERTVRFTFDRVYSQRWVLMNQLTLITPMPRAWDRDADGPADASGDLADVERVYDYLAEQNGPWTEESNEIRTRWADSPVWSVVNGPWRLKEYALDGTVTFVPNPRYSGPNKPWLDEFRQVPIESDQQVVDLLRRGPDGPDGLQVGWLPYGLDDELGAAGRNPVDDRYRLVPQNAYCVRYMPLNFDNPNTAGAVIRQTYFRQALQRCVDQDRMVEEIYHGYAHAGTGPVPRVPDSEFVSPAQRAMATPYDLAAARALLTENGWDVSTTPATCVRGGEGEGCAGAGIAAGDRLTFGLRVVEGREALRRMMDMVVADAATVGIELRAETVHGSVMVGQDHSELGSDHRERWEINCWNGGWAFYGDLTGEMLFRTRAGSNYGQYSDPTADALIEETVVSTDLDAMYRYQDYLADQVPVVWMPGFPLRLFEVAKDLRGIEPINLYGVINPENWYYVAD